MRGADNTCHHVCVGVRVSVFQVSASWEFVRVVKLCGESCSFAEKERTSEKHEGEVRELRTYCF